MKAAHAHEVVGVLDQLRTSRPAGGRAMVCSPVKQAAAKLGLRVLQPEKLDESSSSQVRSLAPDILVVAAYGRIFRPPSPRALPDGRDQRAPFPPAEDSGGLHRSRRPSLRGTARPA